LNGMALPGQGIAREEPLSLGWEMAAQTILLKELSERSGHSYAT